MGRHKKEEGVPAESSLHMFARIPKLIAKEGRVVGFEKLRDIALGDWETLAAKMNPYSALKLAIEFDRHAMFAEVAQAKIKDKFDAELWKGFQDYLHGNVEAAPEMGRLNPEDVRTPPAFGNGLGGDTEELDGEDDEE